LQIQKYKNFVEDNTLGGQAKRDLRVACMGEMGIEYVVLFILS